MKEYLIKWNSQDENRLKKAVSDFNKKIKRLEKEEKLLYLPDTIDYQATKENITTRAEYNRKLNALQSFMKQGAEDIQTTKGGQKITKWEWQQTLNQKRILENRLNKEISDFEKISPSVRGYMGLPDKVQAEDTLASIQKISTVKGAEFNRVKSRVQTLGTKDYNMKRAEKYRQTVLKELEDLKGKSKATEKLYEKLKEIKNPIEFYEKVKESDVMYDFFKWYKNPKDYGSFKGYGTISKYVLDELEEAESFEEYILDLIDDL